MLQCLPFFSKLVGGTINLLELKGTQGQTQFEWQAWSQYL
jgi:hypothetical protein